MSIRIVSVLGAAAAVSLAGVVVVACVGDSSDAAVASTPDATTTAEASSSGAPDGSSSGSVDGSADAGDGSLGCVDASASDPNNCGACGHVCASGFACTNSQCDNDVVDVTAGAGFGCALLHGGTVYCWGRTANGDLGVDPSASDVDCGGGAKCRTTPVAVAGLTDAVQISAGDDHTCAVKRDGTVACWGANDLAELGQTTTALFSSTPLLVPLPANTKVSELAAQETTTCAVTNAGEVFCWGGNGTSQVGKAVSASELPFKVIAANATYVVVSGDRGFLNGNVRGHACALVGAQVLCWGANNNGESGTGLGIAINPTPSPVKMGGADFAGAKVISNGPAATCAMNTGGEIFCWGLGDYGLIPPPTGANFPEPTKITGLPLSGVALAQNAYAQFVLTSSGDVWGWGGTSYGMLATGSEDGGVGCMGIVNCTPVVVNVTSLAKSKKIAMGVEFGVALREDGSVVTWGINREGSLGHVPGTNGDVLNDALLPVVIAGLPK